MRKIFPVFAILLGLFWLYMACFQYTLWVRRGPGGGFFPLVGGGLIVFFSILYLVKEIKHPLPASFSVKFLHPILAVLGMLLASYLLGMIPCMFLFILLWLRFYEKYTIPFSLSVSAGAMAVLYGIFVLWLRVPLPEGMLGAALWG